MRLGQWLPDAGRRFRRREVSRSRGSARTVRSRDRCVVIGTARRTVRFWDRAAVRGALRLIVAQAHGLSLAVRTLPLRKPELVQVSIKRSLPSLLPLPSPVLSPFLSLFPLDSVRCGGGVHSRCPLPPFIDFCGREWSRAWLQHRNHVVCHVGRVCCSSASEEVMPKANMEADTWLS